MVKKLGTVVNTGQQTGYSGQHNYTGHKARHSNNSITYTVTIITMVKGVTKYNNTVKRLKITPRHMIYETCQQARQTKINYTTA